MSFFDLILLIIIGGFALFGVWFGLIHTLGSLVGTVLGVFLATRYYAPVAEWLIRTTGWSGNFSRVVIFIIAFVIINRLIGLAFFLIDRVLSIVTRLPFISGLNRFLGLVFGLAEGFIVLGMVFYFINKFPLSVSFMERLVDSKIAPYCIKASAVLWPFIPDALKILKDTMHGVLN